MIRNIDEFDNLIILRSLTKSFGLAGLRLGYSVSNPRLAKKLASGQISWNVKRDSTESWHRGTQRFTAFNESTSDCEKGA